MKVSVIIPNYNHENYLDIRIQSVLNQTYQDYEVIILDDCSTDNSRAIIEKYRNNNHISHIIYNEHNSGSTFKQWEKGIALSKGELIWIAESDDACKESFLLNIINAFENPDVVLSFSRSVLIDSIGKRIGLYPTQEKMNQSFCVSGSEFLSSYLTKRNIVVNASSAVFRRNIVNNIPKDYYELKGCGDWLFWIHVAELGWVYYNYNSLNYFRRHSANTTSILNHNGRNAKETHAVYDYLSSKRYFRGISKRLFKLKQLVQYQSKQYFYDEKTKKEVFKEWDFSLFDYFLAYCLRLYWLLIFLKNKLYTKKLFHNDFNSNDHL